MEVLRHLVKGIDPVADAFDSTGGTVAKCTDIVSMRNYKRCEFIIFKGVGATGVSTITVEACSTVGAAATSAIPFYYQAITSGDTPGALTAATSAGFSTTAGSSQLYRIVVNASDLASSGYEFVRMSTIETTDSPVLGCVLIELYESKDGRDIPATAIV